MRLTNGVGTLGIEPSPPPIMSQISEANENSHTQPLATQQPPQQAQSCSESRKFQESFSQSSPISYTNTRP